MAFSISSEAFAEGAPIPVEFTCEGRDAPPPIRVDDAPAGTRGFALIMEDPDAPAGIFTHWLAYDIPAQGPELQTSRAITLPNGFGRTGYGGPCPPRGHGPHRYVFRVYALDASSLDVHGRTRRDLEQALAGHTLATAELTARYERRP